jgi:hypothetical protein
VVSILDVVESLSLTNCALTAELLAALGAKLGVVATQSPLKGLGVSANPGVADEAWIALFQQLPSTLTKLDLGDNKLPDNVLAALAQALSARGIQLRELFLDGNCFTDIAPILPCCGMCTELDVGDNSLTDPSVRAIAQRLKSWPVETLVLGSNPQITSTGVLPLVYALPQSRVNTLFLDNTGVNDDVLQALADVLHDTKLEELHVDHTKVGDAGILALCNQIPGSAIRSLDISDNNISEQMISEIQAAIPDIADAEMQDCEDNDAQEC